MFLHLSFAEWLSGRTAAAGMAFRAEPVPKVMLNPPTNGSAAAAAALNNGAPPGVPMR